MDNIENYNCSAHILDTMQLVSRGISCEVEGNPEPLLSMQQFRAMYILKTNPAVSLSFLARHLGCTLSSASRLVDSLVDSNYIERSTDSQDRRRLILEITTAGNEVLANADNQILDLLSRKLENYTVCERTIIELAMKLIKGAFVGEEVHA